MPHGFEYIVRPFQAPGSLGNIVIPGTPQRTPELARVIWGGQGQMPSTKLLYPSTVVNTKKETLNEQDRDTETKRIVGNDGESYVDVARALTLRLDKLEQVVNDRLNQTLEVDVKLDPAIKAYVDQYLSKNVAGADGGKSAVTWNLKNE